MYHIIGGMRLCLLSLLTVLACSCSRNETNRHLCNLSVKIERLDKDLDLKSFQITLNELKSGLVFVEQADERGLAVFEIPMGSYRIIAEDLVDGAITRSGEVGNFVMNESDLSLRIAVDRVVTPNSNTFKLDELYFNGAKGTDSYKADDQYFTIKNVSDKALYVDGLSFGITGDINSLQLHDDMSQFLPHDIILSQVYTIPGTGRDFKVEPNESFVVALSAIDHSKVTSSSRGLDLSGADLEIYIRGAMTEDNPDIPNAVVNYTLFNQFNWLHSGSTPLVLFWLDDKLEDIIEQNRVRLRSPGSRNSDLQTYIKIPTNCVIDAVETGLKDQFYHKVIPNELDRGAILVEGSSYSNFREQFIKRRIVLNKKGEETIQDSNNSTEDFIVQVGGQKSYPK